MRHDLGWPGLTGRALLGIQAGLAAVSAGNVYARGVLPEDALSSLIALLQAVVFIAAGVCVLLWTWRAKANTRETGARDLSFSPTMAVVSYFIPLINLAMPLQAMRELWKAGVDPRDWEAVDVPAIFGLWWAFWIAGNIAGIAAWRLSETEAGMVPPDVLSWFFVASDIGTLLASVLLIRIIAITTDVQRQRAPFAA